MNIQKAPALLLALALQIFPICRVACVNTAAAPTGFAIVMRWLAGAVALLGSYHAVSGASAAITGLAPINSSGVQTGPVTTSATGTVGKPFLYRIIVTNPGTDHLQDFWNAFGLPPGLTINTNLGGTGWITNTPTTAGLYSRVTLLAGNANCSCFVTLSNITITITGGGASPPQITGPPANQTVPAGTNVSFTVTATGAAPLSYLWKFNGAAIAGATTSSLQLSNVQTTNSGTYLVTVTNTAGSASASATLTVNAGATAPSITAQPQSLTVSNGATAGFSVTAAGTAPLSYQWLKGASSVPGATNATYTIPSVSTNDAGAYSVVVTNSAGSATSSPATLIVLVPPSILIPPQNQTVPEGTNVSFTVTADGSLPFGYSWKFNGATIAGATTSSLQLSNVQTTNSGTYSVTITNSAGSTFASATLTVNATAAAPSIITPPQSLTVSNGAAASFSVTAGGSQPLSYQWFKGGEGLSGATNETFTLTSVTTNDAGAYTIVVTNSAGSITSSVATLTVLFAPTILTPPQSLTVTNGDNANFSVVAGGSPTIQYQWKFNGANLTGATLSSLAITNAQAINQGDYTVAVSNAVGTVTSAAAHLTVQTPAASTLQLANFQTVNRSWSCDVTGPAQTNFVVWASTNLTRWLALGTNFSATGTAHFAGSNAPVPVGFYRATSSP